jgi:hypothetical protein
MFTCVCVWGEREMYTCVCVGGERDMCTCVCVGRRETFRERHPAAEIIHWDFEALV